MRDTFSRISEGWGRRGTAGSAIPKSLSFEGIGHSYGTTDALHDIQLTIAPGEIIGLLGPSGCGKSTLLRIAAGLERPTHGQLLMDGQVMAGPDQFVPAEKRGIGLVFQDFALFPHMTVLDNVTFGLRSVGRSEAERIGRHALERVGLASYAADYPQNLSGGEQQRVALARAIAPRPGILLLDEPFSGLDQRLRDDVRDETLAVLRETRATSIIVTHDPEEAMRMADRIVLLRAGRIIQTGRAVDIYSHPVDLDAARFFSDINVLSGFIRDGVMETPLGRFPATHLAQGTAAVAAIRPQAVTLLPQGSGVSGRVLRRRFLGEFDLVDIAVDGLDVPLKARLRQSDGVPDGKDVSINILGNEVLVFAAPDA